MVPPLNHGRLGWFVERLAQHKVDVSSETVRKWFAGDTRPRHAAMKALAAVLQVDLAWLSTGNAPEFSEAQRKTNNLVAGGVVNIVAGFLQVDGSHPSFPDEDDPEARANKINLYAIIKGAHYRFHIVPQIGDGRDFFPVPTEARGAIVLGVVVSGFSARIYELDWETVESVGTKRGAIYEVALKDAAKFKEITSFASRL